MNEQSDLFGDPVTPSTGPAKPGKDPADLAPAPLSILREKALPCTYGCGQPIVFAATVRTMRGGAQKSGWMPVDPDNDVPGGNIRLHLEGRVVRAYVLNKQQREGRTHLHRSHMETCTARPGKR